jgi:hypothetical protein
MGGGGMGGGAMAGGMGGASHGKEAGPVAHITAMSGCFADTLGIKELKKGQKWELEAFYDYSKHGGMKHDSGTQENVMGIAIMYVKNPKI